MHRDFQSQYFRVRVLTSLCRHTSLSRNADLIAAKMSDFNMFVLKVPSLLQLDGLRADTATKANLKNLFGIENIPSDTSLREILDWVYFSLK